MTWLVASFPRHRVTILTMGRHTSPATRWLPDPQRRRRRTAVHV